MSRSFLTARWTNLILANYPVPPELLQNWLPPGLELDRWQGRTFVSLVAFDFQDTRVLGVPWPGYRRFPELNLRFYVRRGTERGVVFIREIVPKRLVVWLARWLYHEPYRHAPLQSLVRDESASRLVEHRLNWAGKTHVITATGSKPGYFPPADGEEHFFKEHRWGYGLTRSRQTTLRYEVAHPTWEVFNVQTYRVEFDWASVYGAEWDFLNAALPASVILAAGSEVAVYPHGRCPVP